jgi:hypothetical protein
MLAGPTNNDVRLRVSRDNDFVLRYTHRRLDHSSDQSVSMRLVYLWRYDDIPSLGWQDLAAARMDWPTEGCDSHGSSLIRS